MVAYAGAAFFSVLAHAFQAPRRRGSWLPASTTLVMVVLAVLAASLAAPGSNTFVHLIDSLGTLASKTKVVLIAAGFLSGLISGFSMCGLARWWQRAFCRAAYVFTILLLSAVMLRETDLFLLPATTPATAQAATGYHALDHEPVAQLSIQPTSITAGPDDRLYVAGYYGMSCHKAMVLRLDPSPDSEMLRETVVVDFMTRIHGIAFFGQDIYISRAGQFTRAVNGLMIHENTGAVTRARDLDGDGVFEHFTDTISGLPGAVTMHQNNGIVFGTDGTLYVTVGYPHDLGHIKHPWAGTVIRTDAEGTAPVVFARGFRNPYDLVIGPDGQLFGTDNDSNISGKGDELNHIVEGGHYGHPYMSTVRQAAVSGVVGPLINLRNPEGITYVPPGFLSEGFDDCFYIASWSGGILCVRLQRTPDSYRATSEKVSDLRAVDITFVPGKGLFACSFRDRLVYRLFPR